MFLVYNNKSILKNLIFKDSCNRYIVKNECFYDYGFSNQDKDNYGLGWTFLNKTEKNSNLKFLSSFEYKSSSELDNFPYIGDYSTYYGGGYVFKINSSLQLSDLQADLIELRSLNWINKQTRALFVEFSLFNSNVNLFGYCTILFEYLSTGNFLQTSYINTFSLYNQNSLGIACDVILVFFILFFMIQEIRLAIKLGPRVYFTQFWIYINWLIILLTWSCVAIYFYRIYARNDLLNRLNGYSKSKKWISLQNLSYWNDVFIWIMAICSFMVIIKFIKILRFSRVISNLIKAIKSSTKDLTSFFVLFFIIWFSFVNLMYLIMNDKKLSFNTVLASAETTFQILLGKFQVNDFLKDNSILAPFIFILYNVIILLIMLNVFVTIVSEHYALACQEDQNMEDRISLMDFFIQKLRYFFKKRD